MKLLLFAFILFTAHLSAQREGDKWVIGYSSELSTEQPIMYLDFNSGNLKIEWHYNNPMRFFETGANICDSEGEPILSTNGMRIYGTNGVSIADTICFDTAYPSYWLWCYHEVLGPLGFPEHEGALVLPVPTHQGLYSVISHTAKFDEIYGFRATQYLESRVQHHEDGTYTLLFRDSAIGTYVDTYTGPIIASRHGNGRDWWVVNFETNSGGYFTHLLDPGGIKEYRDGGVDSLVKDGLGQAVFSPLGNYIARVDAITINEGQYITLYDFDRCTGKLKRKGTFHTTAGYFTGVAFSPSERFLYADDNSHLWQWDLWAEDIAASQILIDTFDGFVDPGWFNTSFAPMMQTPDGRIYIVPASGSSQYLHVINRPDLPGDETNFTQHSVYLTKHHGRSAPNIPNFRLGAFDGSPCDTLNIDNHPESRWRYEEDEPGFWHTIRFNDLSFFNPTSWLWDFGDGFTSLDQSPVHYFEEGLYYVCLTVSNKYSSDTSCQWINIINTATKEWESVSDLFIAPNPFEEKISIHSRSGIFIEAHLQITDMHGRTLLNEPNAPVPVTLYMPELLPGMYLLTIIEQDGKVNSFKLMKI